MKNAVFSVPAANDADTTVAIEIRCQDCIEGMKALPADSIDVVVTSPPYNLGIRYGKYDDTIPRAQYLEWIEEWAQAVSRVLAPDGSLFLNVGGKPTDPWGPFEVARRMAECGFELQNTIHWIKSVAIDAEALAGKYGFQRDLSVGHYKPVNSPRFVNDCHEYIFHFTRSGSVELDRLAIGVPYQDKTNIGRWNSARQDCRCRGNTWYIPYDTIVNRAKERPHPASFPTRLPEWCFRLHGVGRIRRCMDPFLGIGTSAIAATRLGLPFVGFEIDPDYFAEASDRVEVAAKGRREQFSRGKSTALDLG